jgi:hypothetical protein
MVRVVSKQFDRVRVEQNHCHGLMTVKASAAHEVVLRSPYARSASFQV